MRARAHAALLAAVFVLAGCSDYGLPSDRLTSPGEAGATQLSNYNVKLGVGKVVLLASLLSDGRQAKLNKPTSWRTSDSTVVVVDDSGAVTAVAPGTATVTGNSSDSTKTTVTVYVTPASAGADSATSTTIPGVTPELPRTTVDVSMPSVTGHSIRVNAGGDLQAALNSAQPGDEIVLQAGATFTGNFTLPAKSGAGWIVVRSSGSLPAAGTRVHPNDAPQMAKLVSQDPFQPVVQTALGAHNIRLVGLEMTVASGASDAHTLVALGDGSPAQKTVDQVAHDLVLDRVYIHGSSSLNFQRCIGLNSGSTAIVDSYISECHGRAMDSQAIAGWNGTGPYRIEDNFLEGAGENVMFGGASPSVPNSLPRDIVIRHNYFYKPAAWKGVWEVKNLLEFKIGQRVLIEGNVFQNNWADGQDGFAILFKSTDQDGVAPWSQTSDVTFQNNIVQNSPHGVSMAGHPEVYPVVLAARIKLYNNVFRKIGDGDFPGGGRLFQMSGVQGLILQHNTGFTPGLIYLFGQTPKISGLVMQDNLVGSGRMYISSADGFGIGTDALNAHAGTDWVFSHNVVVGAPASLYPGNNQYPATTAELNLSTDGSLPAGSPYLTGASDGGAIGADIHVINAATAGVTN